MDININSIIGWIAFMALILSFYSVMYMNDYLYRKGLVKHKLFIVRLDVVFIEYYKISIKEYGHAGVWFWIFIYSFIIMIISGMTSLGLSLSH